MAKRPQILVVDDDLVSRETMRGVLEASGFVAASAGAMEASDLLLAMPVDCLVVATSLAGGPAEDLVRRVREGDPRIGIVIVAEGCQNGIEAATSGLDVWAIVPKPVEARLLAQKVRTACEYAQMPSSTKTKLANNIQAEVAHFQRVKRESRSIEVKREGKRGADLHP